MNGHGTNFDGLDEATLLAFVEGGLGAAEEATLRRTLPAEVLASLQAMRGDRGAVARLPEPPVPAGLAEAAMARAQREALHSLRLTGEQEVQIPVSRVAPVRRSWLTPARGAMAAAALLGVVGGLSLIANWPGGGKNKGGGGAGGGTGVDVAQGPIETPGPVAPPVPAPENVAAATPGDETPADGVRVASADPVVVPMAPLAVRVDESARVLALAKSGRLVLRVTPKAPGKCEQQLASLEARSANSQLWRAKADAPADIRLALARPAPAEKTRVEGAPDEPALGGVDGFQPMIIRPVELPSIAPPRVQDLVAMLRVAPTADALNAVRAVLSEQLGAVEFAEMAAPLSSAEDAADQATIESLLWWSGSPTQWARWASVPVVVER